MLKESYTYIPFENRPYYYFESEGQQGKITKIVLFTRIRGKFWNLAFGDWLNGQLSDSVVSNNQDIVKLISTIAKITYQFSEEFPLRHIRIKPVDEKRRKLYHHVFRRNYDAISETFQIIGVRNDRRYLYSPKKNYDFFELKRKFA